MLHRYLRSKMPGLAFIAAVALSVALTACGSGATTNNFAGSTTAAPTGTVQGQLLDASTNEPIVGAVVDIGVATGTTNSNGQFTIAGVPINVDTNSAGTAVNSGTTVGGVGAGTYAATINMSKVTSPVDMTATGTTAPTIRYANYYLTNSLKLTFSTVNSSGTTITGAGGGSTVTTTNNSLVVPVANVMLPLGKLSATIKGEVGNSKTLSPVGAGYTVELLSANAVSSTGTGNTADVVSTTTTDANGLFTFANVEAGKGFLIRANNATATAAATMATPANVAVTAPLDGQILNLPIQSSNAPAANKQILVSTTDNQPVRLIAVSPVNNADIAPAANTTVTFTFSEAIQSNTYTDAVTPALATLGGIYNDVVITYVGAKAGNIAHTMAWSTDRKQLIVTIPTLSVSSKYTVSLAVAVANVNFVDINGLAYDAVNSLPNLVTFTTNGGTTVAAPVVAFTNSASIDFNNANVANFDWLPVPGAIGYNLYCTSKNVYQDGTIVAGTSTLLNATPLLTTSSLSLVAASLITIDGQVAIQHDCNVKAVNTEHVEGAASNTVNVKDLIAPVASTGVAVSWVDKNGAILTDAQQTQVLIGGGYAGNVAVPMLNGGTLYPATVSLSVTAPQTAGGTLATATAIVTGGVLSIAISGGTGYTAAPTITINTAPGAGGTAAVIDTVLFPAPSPITLAPANGFFNAAAGDAYTGTFTVNFNENVRKSLAEDKTKFVISANGDKLSSDVAPTLASVTWNSNTSVTLNLTLTKAAGTNTYGGRWNLDVTAQKDIAGNASTNKYYNVTDTQPTTPITAGWH